MGREREQGGKVGEDKTNWFINASYAKRLLAIFESVEAFVSTARGLNAFKDLTYSTRRSNNRSRLVPLE